MAMHEPEPRPRAASPASIPITAIIVAVLALFAAGIGLVVGRCSAPSAAPAASATVIRSTPAVLRAVRDLARLESAEFHMERVVDLTEKQSRFFGLIEAEDAILLVAAGDVVAGVDLAKLGDGDIVVDEANHRVRITLPPAQILSAKLDNERTYVHTRRTDVLASRKESLETRARQEAERSIVEAATQAGILERARQNAKRTIETLIHSLGYSDVDVRFH